MSENSKLTDAQFQEKLGPIMRASASKDHVEASANIQKFLALAEEPLREGIFDGSTILNEIFTKVDTAGDMSPRFPLHFLNPGTETEFGMIPYRTVSSDDIALHSYRIANSIDACRHYIKNARWDVVTDMIEAYQAGFRLKIQQDGARTLMAAALGRGHGLVVNDAVAGAGVFTFKLLSLMINKMKRLSGGNSTSFGGYRLTDMLVSPEVLGDMRELNIDNWTVDRYQVLQDKGHVYNLFGVNFWELFELGEEGSLQEYSEDVLGYTMAGGDKELVLGLDLTKRGKKHFVMPVTQELETSEDPYLHRQGRWGIYGDMWLTFGVLDNRPLLVGSL
jgi:hypothetical protein